jgi:hypothetical protein
VRALWSTAATRAQTPSCAPRGRLLRCVLRPVVLGALPPHGVSGDRSRGHVAREIDACALESPQQLRMLLRERRPVEDRVRIIRTEWTSAQLLEDLPIAACSAGIARHCPFGKHVVAGELVG